jgi:CRP-like cAMP-binding protein
MFDLLRHHITKRIDLGDEAFATCCAFFVPRKVKKNRFLLEQGDVCRHLIFVNDGCLREYHVDHKGEEHVAQFAIRDWWISDLESFLAGTPSTQCIDTLQDSDILVLERDARERMLAAVPGMERFFRMLAEKKIIAASERIRSTLSKAAEERYLDFLDMYPTLAQTVPQRDIASYLGITPQSLSRIRKELAQQR